MKKKAQISNVTILKKVIKKCVWDSADLNRGPSVPNARGWTKLPYYPKGYFLSKEIILYIIFVRTWICHASLKSFFSETESFSA